MQAFLKSGKLGSGDNSSKEKPGLSGEKKRKVTCTPWVEKYRPRTVNDVVQQNEVVEVLKQCLTGGDLPNLLFYGPPGTGKTSTILAAARQMFGDIFRDRILELNASDERGINVIREKVRNFAQTTVSGIRADGQPCPPFKIIILDEADSMTHAAQAALRRMMEKESKSTRFCLICNYVSRIIQPLTSRCTKFRFKPLDSDMIMERLKLICSQENVTYNSDILQLLVETSEGDMRRAITSLQSCAKLCVHNTEITVDHVFEVTGLIPEKWIQEFIDVCKSGKYENIENYIDKFMSEGYCVSELLDQVLKIVISSEEMSDKQKSVICRKLSLCEWRIQDGATEFIEILDFSCALTKAIKMVG